MASLPAAGSAAPSFTLSSTAGIDVTLSKLRGKNVLPISVDSIPTLKEFKAKEGIGVDLLGDFKREVSRSHGTLIEGRFFPHRQNEELLAQLEAHRRSA